MPGTNDGKGDGLGLDWSEESDPKRVQTSLKAGHALSEAGFGDVCVLTHEEIEEVLTPTAKKILRTLANTDVESVEGLAQEVDHDLESIAQNVERLATDGLLKYEHDGQTRRPVLCHDTYILEPVVADIDAVPDVADAPDTLSVDD